MKKEFIIWCRMFLFIIVTIIYIVFAIIMNILIFPVGWIFGKESTLYKFMDYFLTLE